MAQSDNMKRYLDAGVAFTQMTRERAEEIVKELVSRGEVARKEAGSRVDELLDRSRKQSEELIAIVRSEVARQLKGLGLDDLAKRAGTGGPAAPAAKASTPAPSTAKKVVKKAPSASKATAGKAGAAKTGAKKATTKKATTKKAGTKKATTKKATAKKAPAKKSGAPNTAAKDSSAAKEA